jgi:predicted MFS family arabinose efflux permease
MRQINAPLVGLGKSYCDDVAERISMDHSKNSKSMVSGSSDNPKAVNGDAWPWWSAFAHLDFSVIWAASTAGLIGIAMADTASAWLMTSLKADPAAVSMVQVATNLPMFLFTMLAGALADILNPRRFLIVVETGVAILTLLFAIIVSAKVMTPFTLLAITFALSAAWTMAAPAWLSIVPVLVPKRDLDGATAINAASYNVSRALGPALGGGVIAAFGLAAPYWIFGASTLAAIIALVWWRSPQKALESLPVERLGSALRTGVRHAANNQHLCATLVRTLAFFVFASAYWALMPLLALTQMSGGPQYFGVLLGAIGAGAIAGALALNWLKAQLGPDGLVAAGTVLTAVILTLFGIVRDPTLGAILCFVAGGAWILVLASLYVSAQVALPDWVRGRGLAIFLTVIFGAMTAGSVIWGQLATAWGLPITLWSAAAGIVLAIPLTWRWKIQTGATIDLSPSLHWRRPHIDHKIESREGPVLVTVEYWVDSVNRPPFLRAIEEIGHERKRDGAYAWGIFEDATEKERYWETFQIESWLELQRLRERVTKADRITEDRVRLLIKTPQKATFMVRSRSP